MTSTDQPQVDTSGFNTNSGPSGLKITDMRIAVVGHGSWRWPIIKLYTNQGLVGLGEAYTAGPDLAVAETIRYLGEWLIGQDVTRRERIWAGTTSHPR